MNILDWLEQWLSRIVQVVVDLLMWPYRQLRDLLQESASGLLQWVLSLIPDEFNEAIERVKDAIDVADLFLPVYDCVQLFLVAASVVLLIKCIRWGMRFIPGVVL